MTNPKITAAERKRIEALIRVLVEIIVEGMMTNEDGTLIETFKPPCQVCATTKRLASKALGVKPFWEDDAGELNRLIMKG